MVTERAIKPLVYPPALNDAYHRWNVLLAHWDRNKEPGKLTEIQAVEAEIRRREADYEADIGAYLREDNWVTETR